MATKKNYRLTELKKFEKIIKENFNNIQDINPIHEYKDGHGEVNGFSIDLTHLLDGLSLGFITDSFSIYDQLREIINDEVSIYLQLNYNGLYMNLGKIKRNIKTNKLELTMHLHISVKNNDLNSFKENEIYYTYTVPEIFHLSDLKNGVRKFRVEEDNIIIPQRFEDVKIPMKLFSEKASLLMKTSCENLTIEIIHRIYDTILFIINKFNEIYDNGNGGFFYKMVAFGHGSVIYLDRPFDIYNEKIRNWANYSADNISVNLYGKTEDDPVLVKIMNKYAESRFLTKVIKWNTIYRIEHFYDISENRLARMDVYTKDRGDKCIEIKLDEKNKDMLIVTEKMKDDAYLYVDINKYKLMDPELLFILNKFEINIYNYTEYMNL